ERLITLANDHPEARESDTDRVVDAWIDAEAYRLYTWNTVSRALHGEDVGVEGSINKIFWSEHDRDLHETALSLRGANAEIRTGAEGHWVDDYLFSIAGPIY